MKKALALIMGLTCFACSPKTEKVEKDQQPISQQAIVEKGMIEIGADERSFIAISDIHLDIDADSITPSPWGHGWTDTDRQLWEYTKTKLSAVLQQKESLKIDFMVFTGDIPFHAADDDPKRAKNIGVVLSYLSKLSEEANLPLLFVPGNNDGLAGDYSSFRNEADEAPFVKDSLNSNKWPFIGNSGSCNSTVQGSCYIDYSEVYGYYAAYPLANKKLRFIGLNTVINNNRHSDHLCYNPPADGERQAIAAALQMEWFVKQMEEAAAANEKILIAMHIPPGINGHSGHPSWESFVMSSGETIGNAFVNAVLTHHANVVGVLTGHTHKDELKLFLDAESKVAEICLFTPGITPQHGNNPGFKLYSYHKDSYELMDFTTYWGDFFSEKKVQPLDKTYSFSNIYQKPISLSIQKHLHNLWTNDSTAIQHGMAQTFNVGMPITLNDIQKAAIEIRIDPNAVPIDTSACVDK